MLLMVSRVLLAKATCFIVLYVYFAAHVLDIILDLLSNLLSTSRNLNIFSLFSNLLLEQFLNLPNSATSLLFLCLFIGGSQFKSVSNIKSYISPTNSSVWTTFINPFPLSLLHPFLSVLWSHDQANGFHLIVIFTLSFILTSFIYASVI